MDDTYFIPKEIELDKLSTRNILSKAVLVRDIIGKTSNKRTKLITYKIKNIDEDMIYDLGKISYNFKSKRVTG